MVNEDAKDQSNEIKLFAEKNNEDKNSKNENSN